MKAKKKRHPFEKYFRKHGHYPQLKFDDGHNKLTLEFAPGYLRIQSGQTVIWVRRSTWLQVLPRALRLTQQAWKKHPDHDVNLAMHEAYLLEKSLDDQRRQEKKTQVEDPQRRQRQRQRFLKARERALKQQARTPDA